MRSALKKDAPLAALLDAWTLTLQMQDYLRQRAAEFPAAIQEVVHEATAACIEEIEKVALRVVRQQRFEGVREQVYAFARENPMAGGYSKATPKALSESRVEIPALKAILGLPLAPFRAVQGIDSTAQAVHEFNKVAIRFADAAEDLPEMLNSHLQLTLLDIAENDVTASAVRSAERVSESTERFADSAERFAATADALPGRLRTETQGLIEELGAKQEELRATIQQVESATKSVDTAVQRVRETAPELASAIEKVATAGQNLTETANAIRGMVEYFQSLSSKTQAASGSGGASQTAAADSGGRPFDVREYDSAAQSIATAAREMQVLSERLRGLLEDRALQDRVSDLDQRLSANIDRAAQRAEAVASSVMFKGGGLLVAAFVLAIIYRFVTGRRPSRSSTSAG
jgi:methyl-accepting chemotaxis protein